MAKNRIKLCWLLLLMLMYTTSILLSITPAQARYENTVTGHSLVEARAYGMSSDCMVSKGEPALTVLVGELPLLKSTTVSFWLKSSGSDAVGKLAWSVQNPDHMQYLQIGVQVGPERIDPEVEIELLKDVSMDFSLILTPTPIARNTAHEQLKINVLVTWGQEMWGTFQVILPEVLPEEDTPPEETTEETEDPESPSGEGDGSESGNPELPSGGDDGSTEEEPTVYSTDGTESAGVGEGLDEDDSINNETTENDGAITDGTGEEPSDDTGDVIGDDTDDATEEDTEEEEPPAPICMETISRFNPSEKLPLKITVTEDITAIRLGLEGTAEDEIWMESFPDNTRFSLDLGSGYYMMYDGNVMDLRLQEGITSLSLLLDFSDTKLVEAEELTLRMEAYAGENLVKTCSIVTAPDALESCVTRLHPLDDETGAVVYTIEPAPVSEEKEKTKSSGWESRVLSKDNALEFALPMEWIDAELEYSVEMLTMTEHQTLEYRPVTLSASGLSGRYTDYDLTHNLMFKVGENLPQAGTYRLNMKWSYEGICFAQTQTTFFINYSAKIPYTLGSQEVSQ